MRILWALSLAAVWPAWGQFSGLGTPYDGSVVYFSSTLRLKGTNQPNHGKLFVADEKGVRLFRSRENISPAPPDYQGSTCWMGDFYYYSGAEVSAYQDTIAAPGWLSSAGYCRDRTSATSLISASGERWVGGLTRVSPAGRYAIVSRNLVFSAAELKFLDLESGTETPVSLPGGPGDVGLPVGRAIADDGAAVFAYWRQVYSVRPGGEPKPIAIPGALLAIDRKGSLVLYSQQVPCSVPDPAPPVPERCQDVRFYDLRTGETRQVLPEVKGYDFFIGMSDDAQRIAFRRDGQIWIAQADGTGLRAVASDPVSIASAVLSGDGKVLYFTTGAGRLVKVKIETGEQVELIGRTPYLSSGGYVRAGLAVTLSGAGLAEKYIQATPPYRTWLGDLTMWIGDRRVPVLAVSPTEVGFLVPWDTPSGTVKVTAETWTLASPFAYAEAAMQVDAMPAAGAIAHQYWDVQVTAASWPHLGEIIHVFAVGLGAVSPEVPEGAVAPSAEPLARLAKPMTCEGAEVLYAGLAPGYAERIYQVDLRLTVAGYRQFPCSTGGNTFNFLTLNVLP